MGRIAGGEIDVSGAGEPSVDERGIGLNTDEDPPTVEQDWNDITLSALTQNLGTAGAVLASLTESGGVFTATFLDPPPAADALPEMERWVFDLDPDFADDGTEALLIEVVPVAGFSPAGTQIMMGMGFVDQDGANPGSDEAVGIVLYDFAGSNFYMGRLRNASGFGSILGTPFSVGTWRSLWLPPPIAIDTSFDVNLMRIVETGGVARRGVQTVSAARTGNVVGVLTFGHDDGSTATGGKQLQFRVRYRRVQLHPGWPAGT